MEGFYRTFLFRLSEKLSIQDVEEIRFLLADMTALDKVTDGGAKGLLKSLERGGLLSCNDFSCLRTLLQAVDRKDLVALLEKESVNVKGPGVVGQYRISTYRKLLLKLSRQLTTEDLKKMKFLAGADIGAGILENISTPLQLFQELERIGKVRSNELAFLQNIFEKVPRMDLASMIVKHKATRTYGLRPLPADFIERSEDVSAVISLLESGKSSVSVVGKRCSEVVGIKGMGGLGKTVLAQALCWKIYETRQIIWLTVSQTPTIRSLLETLATEILGQHVSFEDEAKAQWWIQEHTKDKDCLVVLDDVWDVNHASAFDVLSGQCQLLITTRNSEVVRGLRGTSIHKLSHLDEGKARALLLKSAEIKENSLSLEISLVANEILKECKGLPLAIALVGASLLESSSELDEWKYRLDGLKQADLEGLRSCFPTESYPYESLMAAIEVSYQSFPQRYKDKFLDLAIFPEDTELPLHVLDIVWSDKSHRTANESPKRQVGRWTREEARFLEKHSVIQSGSTGSCYVIHDILLDYARGKVQQDRGANAVQTQHRSLLEKYKTRCEDGEWAKGPRGDLYYFHNLAYHLCEAGLQRELSCELTKFDWLHAKLEQTDFASMLSDFTYLETAEEEVKLIHRALTLSSNVLSQKKEQLGVQLLGRLEGLCGFKAVERLTQQIRAKYDTWYSQSLVPLNSCLTPPGGPLIRTTDSRSRSIYSIVVSPDREKIYTGSSESSIDVWDFNTGKELQKLTAHLKAVYALALSENGATLVSGSFDWTIKIWDVDSFVEKRTLFGHGNWVMGVQITPSENWIVSCSNDSTIRVWDLETGILRHTFTGHEGHVRGIALTPDGKLVVSGSHDCTVKLWSLETFAIVRTLHGHKATVYSVCVTPDGKHAVSGSHDSVVKVWQLSTGRIIRSLAGHSAEVYSVTVTPDNKNILSSGDDRTIRVWSIATGKELNVLQGHSESVRFVTVTRDNAIAVSGSQDYSYKLWDLTMASNIEPFIGHKRPITAVALAADGSTCLTASEDNLIKVWNCNPFTEVCSLEGHSRPVQPEPVITVALHPTEPVAASGSDDFQVKVWNLTTMLESHSFMYEHIVQVMKFSQNGELLICAFQDNKIRLWDFKTESQTQWIEAPFCGIVEVTAIDDFFFVCDGYKRVSRIMLKGNGEHEVYNGPGSNPFPALVLPSGSGILSGSCQGNHLRFWETNSSLEVRNLCGHPTESTITALDATKNEKEVLTCSDCGTISVLDLENGKVLYQHNCSLKEDARITAVKWLPDEQHFVVGNSSGELTLWSKANGFVKAFDLFEANSCLAVLPNSDTVVGSDTGKLLLFDFHTQDILCSYTGHGGSVSAMHVDKPGNFIVTGSCDRSIKTWEIINQGGRSSLTPVNQLRDAHKFDVTAVVFGESQNITFSGSVDNIIVKWDMQAGSRLQEFRCSALGWRANCISIIDERIFACFQDSTAMVWCLSDGKPLNQLVGRGGRYHVARVLPESNQVFSDGSHYTIQHWTLEPNGKSIASFEGHTDEVTSLCLLPGGEHMITGSRDKTLKLWNISSASLVSEFFFEQSVLAVACSATGLIVVGLRNGQLCFMRVK